jgi:hypothetical protein
VEEMKNPDQVQQPIKESMWLVHTAGLWICIINNKTQALRGLKKINTDA